MFRFLPTIIAGILTLTALTVTWHPKEMSGEVSYETMLLEEYRETKSVKQGTAPDGSVVIREIDADTVSTAVPVLAKIPNHRRTLRAFTAHSSLHGRTMLYVEQSGKPFRAYEAAGDFQFDGNVLDARWISAERLLFSAFDEARRRRQYVLDVSVPAVFPVQHL